ncbi:hypothetical protein E3U43_002513 [Larimichthys crocea]|uniref:Uncharacterized protein n=1 Tax=Larimichthys crocea TaxID=215358 RepID=A0ACD3QRW2_LARCR|nr:hypothetical protein E3U43_002513 [Larimichthys crocea]
MSSSVLDEQNFHHCCRLLLQQSEQLKDGWSWEAVQGSEEGYLRKTALRSVVTDSRPVWDHEGSSSESEPHTPCHTGLDQSGLVAPVDADSIEGDIDDEEDEGEDEGACTVSEGSSQDRGVHEACAAGGSGPTQTGELRVVVAQCGGSCGGSGRPSEVLHPAPSNSLTQQHQAKLKLNLLCFTLCQHHCGVVYTEAGLSPRGRRQLSQHRRPSESPESPSQFDRLKDVFWKLLLIAPLFLASLPCISLLHLCWEELRCEENPVSEPSVVPTIDVEGGVFREPEIPLPIRIVASQ